MKFLKNNGKSEILFLALALLFILFLRGSTLELVDLIDPTESRYAVVAQEMVLTNDWVTPRLAEPQGVVPYLGKPPLHYWFTAAMYSLFGVEEWTSRLPSFLGGIFIVGCLVTFGRRILTLELGLLASLVFISSPLVFFFVGASVIDVTLTTCLAGAFLTFALGVKENRRLPYYLYFVFLSLAFLTKGPVALVLGVTPVLAWLFAPSQRELIKKIPWKGGIGIFGLITVPWFLLVEARNPGFLRYFIVNENLLRYTVTNYGDKYGNGHIYFRGSAIWMFAVATLPWFIYAAILSFRQKFSFGKLRSYFTNSDYRWEAYCALWGLTPILFFALARQLHAAYIIPAIPPLSLLFVIWGSRIATSIRPFSSHVVRYSSALCIIFTIIIVSFGDYAGGRKSTERILKLIARETKSSTPLVGSTAVNCYSQYWVTGAWREELGEQLTVKYVAPIDIQNSGLQHLILRKGFEDNTPQKYLEGYARVRTIGKWSWWRRKIRPRET